MSWYKDWFNSDLYELVYACRDESDAEKLVDLIERAVEPASAARILDVGTGRGRHARILARRGYEVTGLDLSPIAIKTAKKRAEEEDVRIEFRVGDMRKPVAHRAFDGVVNLFTSFGYFDSEAEHQAAISSMATALKPGGWLVQDFLNARYVRKNLVEEDCRTDHECTITQSRCIQEDALGPRVEKRITIQDADGQESTFLESVRLLTRNDFKRFYSRAGLTLTTSFGDYDGAAWSEESPRLILVARRE